MAHHNHGSHTLSKAISISDRSEQSLSGHQQVKEGTARATRPKKNWRQGTGILAEDCMRYKNITEPSLKKIHTQEWRRAVKMLDPLLNRRKKATVVWDLKPKFYAGRYFGDDRATFCVLDGRWRKAPVISVSKKYIDKDGENGFRAILRHEYLHYIEPKHNNRFKSLCRQIKCHHFYRGGKEIE